MLHANPSRHKLAQQENDINWTNIIDIRLGHFWRINHQSCWLRRQKGNGLRWITQFITMSYNTVGAPKWNGTRP